MKVPQIVPRRMLRHRLVDRALKAKMSGLASVPATMAEFWAIEDMLPLDEAIEAVTPGKSATFFGLRVDISSRHSG